MTDFFNAELYRARPPGQHSCCGRPWLQCPVTEHLLKEFVNMTGQQWPRWPHLIFPVHKDFRLLGRDSKGVPAGLALCLGCSIEYMKTFNRLNEQQLVHDQEPGSDSTESDQRGVPGRPCPTCWVGPAELHATGCPIEQCPRCGGQLLMCAWSGRHESTAALPWPPLDDDRIPWTGEIIGEGERRESN